MKSEPVMHELKSMTCSGIDCYLKSGADVNIRQGYLIEPRGIEATTSLLERAVELGCLPAVTELLERGASVVDKTVWDYYVQVEPPRYRESLVPLWVTDGDEFDGHQLLVLLSIFFGDFAVFRLLYERFSPRSGIFIVCAMCLCVEARQFEMLEFLIEREGAHFINYREGDYCTVFHRACLFQDIEMAQYLLRFGANPNILSGHGGYPLTDAIFHQNEDLALFLIEQGANVNVKLRDRAMPLSMAKKRKLKRVVAAVRERLEADSLSSED